ncbi:ATP-binding protein [Streptomyces canus]|uniref:ATP-binding protein n=1 Tax=Streptomyces canus TaxID=58343 RepID=UPI0033B97913
MYDVQSTGLSEGDDGKGTGHSGPLARRRVAGLAVDRGHPALAGDAALLASELCANALLHGCLRDRLFRVETTLTTTALRIAVTDPRGERLPGTRPPRHDDQFGRGLLIVRVLAGRWAVERRMVGKTVWAELDLPKKEDAWLHGGEESYWRS